MFINRHLLRFSKGHGIKIMYGCLLQLVLTVLATLISLCTAVIVWMIRGKREILFLHSPMQVFILILVLITVRYVLGKKKTEVTETCSLSIKSGLRLRLLEQLFSLGPAYMKKQRTGNVASAIYNKVEYLNEYYTIYLPAAVSALINGSVLIAILFRMERLSAWLCTAGAAGMTVCPMIFYFLMRERGKKEMEAHARYYSDCLDSVQGMIVLKSFHADERQKGLIHEKGEELRKAVMGQLRITMLENVVLQLFAGLGSTVSAAAAAGQCLAGKITADELVFALFLITACFTPMLELINAWHMGYRGIVASYSIIELLEEVPRMKQQMPEENSRKESAPPDILFDDVSFAYEKEEGDVLEHISFSVPAGTTTALVGVSGSGKTTISHLLAGFYEPDEGTVRVGDIVLTEQTSGQIQDEISAVWQDCGRFYGTVEENILVGRPEASHEDVVKAADAANIHTFITSLPEGYDTLIGERGMRFSGGERQRIALARAFLKDAPVLILDEATSSLDRAGELQIQNSLQNLSRSRTCLVIAHRIATIRSADQIIILEKGKIRAKGTHEELMHSSKQYRNLMAGQLQEGES